MHDGTGTTSSISPDLEKAANGTHHQGMRVHHGIHISRHMQLPHQEGYRTPTIEDYERHSQDFDQNIIPQLPAKPASLDTNGHGSLPGVSEDNSATKSHFSLHAELEKLAWTQRLRHFTWTFFTLTMATGGIANVLYAVPFRFPGLDIIGTIFFLFNVLLFIINVILISLRFYLFPETFKASFLHPTESLFAPAAVVSFGTILINISQYGLYKVGPWLNTTVLALFWIDAALAILSSSIIYLIMWSTTTFTISQMTPIWIFPAYPMLIIGPHAGILSGSLAPHRALDIIVGGFTIQGIGYMVALMIYSAFIYRLMTQKLPKANLRPGMFVSVGPSGFTAAGIVTMAANASRAIPEDFMGNGPLVAMIITVVANWTALWLWGLAIWFFIASVGAHWSCIERGKLTFAMTWYSFVFPNTALVTATFAIGKAFESYTIQVLGCVATCVLILMWIFVFVMMIRAIVLKQILWPQKGEDRDEGGFKGPEMRIKPRSRSDGFLHHARTMG